jgi:hypothetical protein
LADLAWSRQVSLSIACSIYFFYLQTLGKVQSSRFQGQSRLCAEFAQKCRKRAGIFAAFCTILRHCSLIPAFFGKYFCPSDDGKVQGGRDPAGLCRFVSDKCLESVSSVARRAWDPPSLRYGATSRAAGKPPEPADRNVCHYVERTVSSGFGWRASVCISGMGPGGRMPALYGRRDARRYGCGRFLRAAMEEECGNMLKHGHQTTVGFRRFVPENAGRGGESHYFIRLSNRVIQDSFSTWQSCC